MSEELLLDKEPTKEYLIEKIKNLEEIIKDRAADKSTKELIQIFIWELLGTAFFAYGIVCSRGNDAILSIYLFGAIFLIGRFTGGHVSIAYLFLG